MRHLVTKLCCVGGLALQVSADAASDLYAALAGYPSLTTFQQFVRQYPSLFNRFIPSDTIQVTVLAPSNQAFTAYTAKNGPISNVSTANLTDIVSYHILAAPLTSDNFTRPRGLTIPTFLKGQRYNNRTAGAELLQAFGASGDGQVVFAQQSDGSDGGVVELQAGLAATVGMSPLNIRWKQGYIHMVDEILTLPGTCTDTIETLPSLEALDGALEDTDAYTSIDLMPNVTCLTPSNNAFAAAGNPQGSMNSSAFSWLILSHVLPQVLYSDHIGDGMEIPSMGKGTIKVTIKGSDIYFNDAKVIQANVLTNNGLMHVVDKLVVSPSTTTISPTSSPTPSPTSGASIIVMVHFHLLMAVVTTLSVILCG